MRRRKQAGKDWPKEVRHGSFVAKLYRSTRTIKGREYNILKLSYYQPGGLRVIRDFGSEDKALAAAKDASKAFALGRPDAVAWSRTELVELDAATKALEGTGVGLYAAIQKFLASESAKTAPERTVAEVVTELAEDRKKAGCSEEHVRDITKRLDPFAKAFACQIASVTPPTVRAYLADLRGEKGQVLSARSRDNARRLVVMLFNFARQQRYISRELAEEIAEIPPPRLETTTTSIFTPGEIAKALEAAEGPDRALLAIGAFCGVRTAELHRLTWEDVRMTERVVVIGADRAKTASRRVIPMPDNLVEWLTPITQPAGQISPYAHEHALSWGLMKIARRAGVVWSRNALRHSFCSYRLAVTKNAATVVHEAGNSPAIDRGERAGAALWAGRGRRDGGGPAGGCGPPGGRRFGEPCVDGRRDRTSVPCRRRRPDIRACSGRSGRGRSRVEAVPGQLNPPFSLSGLARGGSENTGE